MPYREKLVLLLYTLFNIISNQFMHFYADETYYWLWSKKLDFSYFDHPPMVAYMIKLTTIFSDDPMFVRLSAALLVAGTAYILFLLAKKMFDEKTAIYTFYIFLSSIMVLAASTLITPDIPMMFFWSLLLYSAYTYLDEDNKKYALLTGFAAGGLLLSKYTGILPIFTLLLYIIVYKRTVFSDKYFYAAIGIAIVVFSPVIYWNYLHDFISFTFQLNHGIAEEKVFNSKEFFKFTSAQLALFHPLYLLPLFYFILRDKERFTQKKVYLLLPFLFVLLFFSYNALFKYANAQWAAGAYLSAAVLLGYYFAKRDAKTLLLIAVSMSTVVLILLKTPAGDYVPPIKKLHDRLGHFERFSGEIKRMNLNIDDYDYLAIDDYHGTEIAYFFKRSTNVIVLNNARFSQFNIWRSDENNISMESPIKELPSLGKVLFISKSKSHVEEVSKLFTSHKLLAYEEKQIGKRKLKYFFVELQN